MTKKGNELSEVTDKLKTENRILQRQLREAKELIDVIKAENIDAVVIPDKKGIKVYAEKTADKAYRILIEKMNEGAVILNDNGIILYCNSYFANLVKLPLQNVIGSKFKNFISDSSKRRFEALLKKARANAAKEEVYLYKNEDQAVPVLMSVNTLSWDNNYFLSIIVTDLTSHHKSRKDLKQKTWQLEQKNVELRRANIDLATFTYVSSHDLQEPLRKIKNFVTVLLDAEEKKLSEEGKTYLQRTYVTANRMQTLIDGSLAYAHTKSAERNFEDTDLNEIAKEVIANLEETIQERKALIKIDSLGKASVICFQFRQLLQNLLSNSLKFAHPERRPRIIVKGEIAAGNELNNNNLLPKIKYCHISVTDNGIGFDPQYKDRIFEVFQRLNGTDEYSGIGIGLAICKRIVENHNGIITATGKLNKGANFNIYFPAYKKIKKASNQS